MRIGPYQLLAPLGAGPDGVAYRAELGGADRPLEHVELRVLSGERGGAERWQRVQKRLRLAALLQHPGAVAVRDLKLDHEPPLVVLDWVEPGCLAQWPDVKALPAETIVALGEKLAGLLAAAHKLGLAHGRVGPGQVRGNPDQPRLDFTALDVASAPGEVPFAALDAACRAPEQAGRDPVDRLKGASVAGDQFGLGALLFWLLTHHRADEAPPESVEAVDVPVPLRRLVVDLLSGDPDARPTARDAQERLSALLFPLQSTRAGGAPAPSSSMTQGLAQTDAGHKPVPTGVQVLDSPPTRLGRYRLLEKLGQGGMGTVYRAVDETDNSIVAVKMLRPDWSANPDHLRRFHKEARLLAEVNNPFVTNLLEVNEDDGIHYLAMEFVPGKSLADRLVPGVPLDEKLALGIIADAARGLAQAHDAGIVHRDIKPANILLVDGTPPRVKLSDFGLARHVVESESLNVTRAGAVMGTPLYMAPEQGTAEAVDARTDVYALGATLYHALAGRPPFDATNLLTVLSMHRTEPLPPLRRHNPAVSEGVCRVVEKAMAKAPSARYPDAAAFLHDLERLLRGEPSSIAVHPRLPECDPGRVLSYEFSWELTSPPEQLWPHVSNTERLNRAIGLSAVRFSSEPGEASSPSPSRGEGKPSSPSPSMGEGWGGGDKAAPHPNPPPQRGEGERSRPPGKRARRFGHFKKAGLAVTWEEHPFEWVEARRMGVLREYSAGPFRWLVSVVELEPRPGGGTTLHHRLRLEPRNFLGRALAAVEVGIRTRKALERVYRRIDAALAAPPEARRFIDPFEDPATLPKARRRRLDGLLDQMQGLDLDLAVVESLGEFLATATAQEVARIRPLALARRLAVDPQQMTAACLHGARLGMLVLLWDVLCPVCRIPSEVQESLKALRDHGRCDVCRLDYQLDFANSVEMIFRAHPELRDSELATYCVGGPAHSPHVVAQARLAPGERIELDLALAEGAYCLRGPQLPYTLEFRADAAARATRWDLLLSRPPGAGLPRVLKAGAQSLALTNDHHDELVVRVERTAPRADALTAARASALALFRELFPGEVLSPGRLVSVTTLTFLVSRLAGALDLYRTLGDARAFGVFHEMFRGIDEVVRGEGGAVVKTVGEGVLAVFSDPLAAVRTAFAVAPRLASAETRDLRLRLAVHRGPALAATLNDHLDYFGTTVSRALRLVESGPAGVVLTAEVAADPGVAAFVASRVPPVLGDDDGLLLHRFPS